MDCKVVRGAHVVRCMDGLGAKAQVADSHAAALLGIVLEVGLGVPKWMQDDAGSNLNKAGVSSVTCGKLKSAG